METLRIKSLTQGHWEPSAELLETHLSFLWTCQGNRNPGVSYSRVLLENLGAPVYIGYLQRIGSVSRTSAEDLMEIRPKPFFSPQEMGVPCQFFDMFPSS